MTEILLYEALDNIEKLKKRTQDLIQELANKITLHRTSIPIDHPDGSITRAKLFGVFPISTADIADGSITTSKIADGAITTGKLADQSVTPAKLATVNTPLDGYTPAFDSSTGMFKWIPATGLTIHDKSYHRSPVLPDDDVHRTSIPIDHPDGSVTTAKIADGAVTTSKIADGSVTRSKLEDTNIASLSYLSLKERLDFGWYWDETHPILVIPSMITDLRVFCIITDQGLRPVGRWQGPLRGLGRSWYDTYTNSPATASDFVLRRSVGGTITVLSTEAVDLPSNSSYPVEFQIVGSTLRAFRYRLDGTRTMLSASDTTFANGYWGYAQFTARIQFIDYFIKFMPPASPSPQPMAYFEVPVIGSGTPDDPFRPQLPEEIAWEWSLNPQAKRKYDIMKSRGFSDEEIIELFPEVLSCRTNRLALTHSALIVSDTATGKPREYTAIVRVFEQPNRQPHLHPIGRCISELQRIRGARRLSRDEAIRRAKQLDDKLHDVDLLSARELRKDKKQLKKEYIEWRRSQFKVEMEDRIAEMYVNEDKGW